MKKGLIDNAIRRALNIFDKWNDVTGAIPKYSPYYWELQSVIEDAVHCGIQGAIGINKKLNGE